MDTHARRIARINEDTFDSIGLPSDSTVSIVDLKNFLWVNIDYTYPSPSAEIIIDEIIVISSKITDNITIASKITDNITIGSVING